MAAHHLFAYGTLMCTDIMCMVARSVCASRSAVVLGYRRRRLQGECYPAIVPCGGDSVEGVVYADVPEAAWERLDAFEGELYQRVRVNAASLDGQRVAAFAYVLKPQFAHLLSDTPWSLEQFIRDGKESFAAEVRARL